MLALTFLFSTCRDLPGPGADHRPSRASRRPGRRGDGLSLDPVGDNPESVEGFLRRNRLDGWRFLSGSRSQLTPIWAGYDIVPLGASDAEAAAAAAATTPATYPASPKGSASADAATTAGGLRPRCRARSGRAGRTPAGGHRWGPERLGKAGRRVGQAGGKYATQGTEDAAEEERDPERPRRAAVGGVRRLSGQVGSPFRPRRWRPRSHRA